MYQLILVRHGQSEWNALNQFTGWTDVPLTEQGRAEARAAGALLKAHNFEFDLAFTSYLTRAIHTLDIILDELQIASTPIQSDWRLNERHYGALQGLNKEIKAQEVGLAQVTLWRKDLNTFPPLLEASDPRWDRHNPQYKDLSDNEIPKGESLRATYHRVGLFVKATLRPVIKDKKIIIVAHKHVIHAIIKSLDPNFYDQNKFNIETGDGVLCHLDSQLALTKVSNLMPTKK